jgi:STE24 endopeptidase
VIPAVILWTGLSGRLRGVAERLARGRWFWIVAIYGVLFVILVAVVSLPLSWYEGFVREHAYGLSNQALGKWAGDWAKGLAVGGVFTALTLWIPYLLIRKSPRRWWLWSALATVPLAIFSLIVVPIWVEPLFNRFGPLRDKALESQILALAGRAGIGESRVYQVDKSVDTKKVNAYVTGIGETKRIVLWDTILGRLTPDQILFVMGHEMGHYVLHHTLAIIVGAALLALASFYTVHRVAGKLIERHKQRFGFERLADVASLPLLLLLGNVVMFVLTPLILAGTRYMEHEADRFGLEITRNNRAAAETFVRLQQENLNVPRPGLLYVLWRGSHPSLAERIEFANRYRPWGTGGRLRYEHLFRGQSPS